MDFWDTDQLALCAYGGARRVVRFRTIDQVCIDILDQPALFVVAFEHSSREPGYWRDRLK